MIINARIDVSWSGVQKPESYPDNSYYYDLEQEIKEKMDADDVEIVTMDFYDEDDDELNADWY